MSFISLDPTQVDAKSPVDEQLMQQIKDNEDDLNSRLLLIKGFPHQFKVSGPLALLTEAKKKRIDGALVPVATTFVDAKLWMDKPGTSGKLEVDIRRLVTPNTKITEISRLFSSSINSIARASSGFSTQSISRAASQIATQSISQWKSSINISSIVLLGDNLVRYNLASQPDSDWKVGDSFEAASCANAANDGTFSIVEINQDNGANIVVENVSGVAQPSASGNATLHAWSYNFVNPVSSQFAAGESALFAGHTDAGNDGTLPIYAVNSSGNNIIVKNPTGTDQAGVAGNANTNRWIITASAAAPTDFVVGEKALLASHTSGANDGNFKITAVNSGGNNIFIYNPAGVAQGGAAGTTNTNRWIYSFSVDPSADVSVADTVVVEGTTSSSNSGSYEVKQVNRITSDNIVVYNESGASQGGSFGTLYTEKVKLSFASDQSSVYSTDSYIEIFGSPQEAIDESAYKVEQVNRGGGANYNVIIKAVEAVEALGACGRIIYEGRSIFSTKPSITTARKDTNATDRDGQVSSNAVFNANATVLTGTLIGLYIVSIPEGFPESFTLGLT